VAILLIAEAVDLGQSGIRQLNSGEYTRTGKSVITAEVLQKLGVSPQYARPAGEIVDALSSLALAGVSAWKTIQLNRALVPNPFVAPAAPQGVFNQGVRGNTPASEALMERIRQGPWQPILDENGKIVGRTRQRLDVQWLDDEPARLQEIYRRNNINAGVVGDSYQILA